MGLVSVMELGLGTALFSAVDFSLILLAIGSVIIMGSEGITRAKGNSSEEFLT